MDVYRALAFYLNGGRAQDAPDELDIGTVSQYYHYLEMAREYVVAYLKLFEVHTMVELEGKPVKLKDLIRINDLFPLDA